MHPIARQRLHAQHITRPLHGDAVDAVAWFGAVQAQEYGPARWGLGLRLGPRARDAAIARAVDEGRILRTHVMRPTWHFVTPADIRWMLELTAPRIHQAMSSYLRQLELDRPLCVRAAKVFERALRDGRHLTRPELGERLATAGLPLTGVRLGLVALYAELEQVMCSGPYRGKQLTYGLFAERAPAARRLTRDEALAELTRRYFTSHGLATVRDFVWWSGLTTPDAKRGLEITRATPTAIEGLSYWTVESPAESPAVRVRAGGAVHLLPIYDEYLVAFRDRMAVPHSAGRVGTPSMPVTFQHALVLDGQVAGTWKVRRTPRQTSLDVYLLRPLPLAAREAIERVGERYGRFVEATVSTRLHSPSG